MKVFLMAYLIIMFCVLLCLGSAWLILFLAQFIPKWLAFVIVFPIFISLVIAGAAGELGRVFEWLEDFFGKD